MQRKEVVRGSHLTSIQRRREEELKSDLRKKRNARPAVVGEEETQEETQEKSQGEAQGEAQEKTQGKKRTKKRLVESAENPQGVKSVTKLAEEVEEMKKTLTEQAQKIEKLERSHKKLR